MHYYELFFNPTDELVNDGWCIHEDGMLAHTFYVKSRGPIASIHAMKCYLANEFEPNEKYNVDLVNCLKPSTVEALVKFVEIDGVEFELCCGIPA